MIRLDCKSQQYAWGKKGSESVVAQLLRAASRADDGNGGNPSIIKEDQPYAEFWMGTHPNCPSHLAKLGQADEAQSTLATWLQLHPEALGSVVQQRWPVEESKGKKDEGRQLPFLFKVLSISQALSIQAHPDRSLGRILRDTKPQHYPDDNHKPEMALAVTPCEVLCGFRTVAQMALLFRHAPEFARVVGQEHVDQFLAEHEYGKKSDKEVVKPLFDRLMRADPAKIAQGLTELQTRLSQGPGSEDDVVQKTEALVVRLSEQFPGDVGCFVAYFLNHLHLVPGQAVFLGPNVPHAYINGDMVECMASSDNTVRAGLTPKFKDVDTLVEMLTYKCGEPDWVHPTVRDGVRVYSPPVEEFVVSSVSLGSDGDGAAVLPPCDSFGLVLVYDGEGTVDVFSAENADKQQLRVAKGQVYGLPAGHGLCVAGHLTLFKANVNCERAEALRRSSASSATPDVSSAL
jgi:mannose-6-phosphate isomerase